jgi:hypothetical protein
MVFRPVACSTPDVPRLPKRISRARRAIESKRIENMKKIHEELKRTAKEEHEALREFWKMVIRKDDEDDAENKEPKSLEEDEE